MDCSDVENESDVELIDDILGPEDLFNDEADEGEDKQCYSGEPTGESEKYHEDKSKEKVEKEIKTSRVVKKSKLTLQFDNLRGNNGLSALKKLFMNFKFKGNGHEKEDLAKILGILQQWMCYQLCPSFDFESCMLQLEVLGKKKFVQTIMKKYRLGMDEWGEKKSDSENNDFGISVETGENTPRDKFDQLLDEEMANAISDDELSQFDTSQAVGLPQEEAKVTLTQTPELSQHNVSQAVTQPEMEVTLTPEQLERIARNKKLAEERRLKRMNDQCESTETSQQFGKLNEQEITLDRINLEENS